MWYKSLRQLDPEAYVGDTARADLLMRFSGLSTNDKLIVRAYVDQDMKYRSLHEGESAPRPDKEKDKPDDGEDKPKGRLGGLFGKAKSKDSEAKGTIDDFSPDDDSDDDEITF